MEEKNFKTGIVKVAPKNVRIFNGKHTIGLQLSDSDTWFNFQSDEEAPLKELVNTLKKGQEVKFLVGEKNVCSELTVLNEPTEESKDWTEDMTCFADLLTSAHEKGLISISTHCIQVELEKKMALFKATVVMKQDKKEKTYEAYGDATNDNIQGKHIKPHFIRMAETRAIARALRWATNNAQTAEEEAA